MASPAKSDARDLNSALQSCFSPNITTPPFETRLIELVGALTGSREVSVWVDKGGEEKIVLIASGSKTLIDENIRAIAQTHLTETSHEAPLLSVIDQTIVANIALPDGGVGALCVEMPTGGQMARSLAYERTALLSNLSFAQNRHEDLVAQSAMIKSCHQIATGDLESLQEFADQICQITGAQYCAIGSYSGGKINRLVISGQENFTKRAQLPIKLKSAMLEAAHNRIVSPNLAYAARQSSDDGLVFVLEGALRNAQMLPLIAAVYLQSAKGKAASRWNTARLIKGGAMALALVGIGLLPIPDGVEISAEVTATNKRIITAPLNANLATVDVIDNARVVAGETVLARLDTRETELELIGARAERATAVLERETARVARNAALLRNAELEVERLDARIDLLELQRTRGELIAPIDGLVVLDGLSERIGSALRAGDPLLQVIEPNALSLELIILESQISKVSDEATGIFRPDFDPSLRLEAAITNISPALSLTEEIPAIQAKATFVTPPEGLRFGLKGVFTTDRAYRPVWDILYTNLRDWFLLRVWL
ncbi:MAG: HlyD family efflux transporter periplasmic adaptor subunit [Litoreibacter sp.]